MKSVAYEYMTGYPVHKYVECTDAAWSACVAQRLPPSSPFVPPPIVRPLLPCFVRFRA